MTITLSTPSSIFGTTYEFDIVNNQIQITSIPLRQIWFYDQRAINDLHQWLRITNNGNWVLLNTKNENQTPRAGSVEEWARSINNPIGGFYGLIPNFRGRFATFIPPILEHLHLAEVTRNPSNNRMRAL